MAAVASFFLLVAFLHVSPSQPLSPDGLTLLALKQPLSDPLHRLSNWSPSDDSPCSWTGVSCNHLLSVTALNFSSFSLRGPVPTLACRLPSLVSLDFYWNDFAGSFPDALLNCSQLAFLDLSENYVNGSLPLHIDRLQYLQVLRLSNNYISGPIPDSFGRLPRLVSLALHANSITGTVPSFLGQLVQLQYLSLAYNSFSAGPIPQEFGNLTRLTYLWLTNCSLTGSIPASLANLTKLETLDFAINRLAGPIPEYFTSFWSLVQLELYQNALTGPIPHDIGLLSELTHVDMANNLLSGPLPASFSQLKRIQSLDLSINGLTGNLPAGFEELPLRNLSIFNNSFTGHFPQNFGASFPLQSFDVSYNNFRGPLPAHLCDNRTLVYLDTIGNVFEGSIPEAYATCTTLERLRLSFNRLNGTVPVALWGLPLLSILDLQNNLLEGNISSTLGGASSLSTIYLCKNGFSGSLPFEIGKASNLSGIWVSQNKLSGRIPSSVGSLIHLSDLYLQDNQLSGTIPDDIGNCSRLVNLDLSNNQLNGPIPSTLGQLSSLNELDLSVNALSGKIPQSLGNLPLASFNVSDNNLQGPIPNSLMMNPQFSSSFKGNPGLCGETFLGLEGCFKEKSSKLLNGVLAGVFAAVTFLMLSIGLFSFYRRYRTKYGAKVVFDTPRIWTRFYELNFLEGEIVNAALDNDNLIGSGGFGRVHKTTLSNGQTVAIKQLQHIDFHNDGNMKDNGFKAEVETLGSIRHKNIVKLLCCCFDNSDNSLLVYEYMENGSLKDALHRTKASLLDLATRYKIAVGSAQGLAYLHNDCKPPIVHRDVKSDNILLDSSYEARIADFGLARILQNSLNTDVMGTPGYIAPEHCRVRKVTEKSDVYSFGIVLLELVTGKSPMDPAVSTTNIVLWVEKRVNPSKAFNEAFDEILDPSLPRCACSELEQMKVLLNVALLCTKPEPQHRPTMREVVKMLTQGQQESLLLQKGDQCN